MQIEAKVAVRRPVDKVCRFFLDPSAATEWMSNLERFEVVKGHAAQPGAHARLHYLENGRRSVMDDILLEVEPGRRYLSEVRGKGLTARVETRLRPTDDGGTTVEVSWDNSRSHFITRLFLWLLRRRIERGITRDLSAFKRLVEGTDL